MYINIPFPSVRLCGLQSSGSSTSRSPSPSLRDEHPTGKPDHMHADHRINQVKEGENKKGYTTAYLSRPPRPPKPR